MAKLFSKEWMNSLAKAWNEDQDMVGNLKKAEFHATIAYGFKGESNPRGVMYVESGKVISIGEYDDQLLDWDLRADINEWKNWITNGFGLANLGIAVAKRKLIFEKGDFHKMIRRPSLATPFLRHFELMKKLETEY